MKDKRWLVLLEETSNIIIIISTTTLSIILTLAQMGAEKETWLIVTSLSLGIAFFSKAAAKMKLLN